MKFENSLPSPSQLLKLANQFFSRVFAFLFELHWGSLNCQTASNRSIYPRSVYLGPNATLKGLRFTIALIFLGRRFMRVLNRVL